MEENAVNLFCNAVKYLGSKLDSKNPMLSLFIALLSVVLLIPAFLLIVIYFVWKESRK